MNSLKPYRIFPLGDAAITLDFGNFIDVDLNDKIITLFESLKKDPLPTTKDLIPAYSSLTICYDPYQLYHLAPTGKNAREWLVSQFEERLQQLAPATANPFRTIRIPVCYSPEFGLDLLEIASTRQLSIEQIIQIHLAGVYHVYMLGFLPGFAYMGRLDPQLEMPRRSQPRQRVEPGSVGITGLQTGIYPMTCPGGWQLIGRTPLKLFDAKGQEGSICLLHPGDLVQFYSISKDEFESY